MSYQSHRDFHLGMRYEDEHLYKHFNKIKSKTPISGDSAVMENHITPKSKYFRQMLQNRVMSSTSIQRGPYTTDYLDVSQRKPERYSWRRRADTISEGVPFKLMNRNYSSPVPEKREYETALPPEIENNELLKKYWKKRTWLFSKFNEGIKLDEESWYSVTPENIAKEIAQRCKCQVIVDGFCGAGGNTIQFAMTCSKVIAIDIDPRKIKLARNNAEVYGVAHKIQFIVGDFLQLADRLIADVVFLSPPWGGPTYTQETVYDLETMLQPVPFSELLTASRKISKCIAAYLPKNSDPQDITKEASYYDQVEIKEFKSYRNNPVAILACYNVSLRSNSIFKRFYKKL